jgi:hypothetical protein
MLCEFRLAPEDLVGAVRFELTTTCTPCRYATRLRYAPKTRRIISERYCRTESKTALAAKKLQQLLELAAQGWQNRDGGPLSGRLVCRGRLIEARARAAAGEPLLVEQFTDAANEKHFMVLVIAPVSAAFYRLELGELLLPIAQHVRLDPAQVADFTDGEVALCGDGGQRRLTGAAAVGVAAGLHRNSFRPSPSVSGWHER